MRKVTITCDVCKEKKSCTPFRKFRNMEGGKRLLIQIRTEIQSTEPDPPRADTGDICLDCIIKELQAVQDEERS